MRFRVLALAGMLALPSVSAAQTAIVNPEQLPPLRRFAITPFVGVQAPYNLGERYFFTDGDVVWGVREQRAGGPMAGAEVETRVRGPVGVLATVAYVNTGDSDVRLVSTDGEEQAGQLDGPDLWLGRVALSYRLPEPNPDNRRFHPAGFLVAGPSLVRLGYADEFGGNGAGASTHWGFNLGFHAASTLGTPRLAFHFGLEDFVTFWDTDRLRRYDEALYGSILGEEAGVRYDYATSNIVTLRAGLSFRF